MYGKIVFNNVKEFTPSWVKTVSYNQCAKPILNSSKRYESSARAKCFWRMFQTQVCARPAVWQAYIFANAFVITFGIYYPWRMIYSANNKGRSIETAIQKEKAYKKSQESQEEAEEEE